MIVEIKGVQFVNKGAELMLHAVIQKVSEARPDVKFVLDPKPSSPYESRAKLGTLQKLSLRKLTFDINALTYWLPKKLRSRLIKNWGIITEADIDVVLDASGFAYGDQFRTLITEQMCKEVKRAAKKGKHYVLLPQALGTFTRTKDIALLRDALPSASLICARETSSLKHVKELIGESDNLKQFPDFTNLVQGMVPDYFKDGGNKVLVIPNSNMISDRNSNKLWQSAYLDILCQSVELLRGQNVIPVLLNHEGESDEAICEAILDKVGPLELIVEPDPLKVKGIIGASQGIICSRFHGCVSALTQSVPTLGTSWSHKYERLYEEYGVADCLIKPDVSPKELENLVSHLLSGAAGPDEEKIQEYKSQSETMWQEVFKRTGIVK
jgi:colanic acid/amylovoran biosynthesis protein